MAMKKIINYRQQLNAKLVKGIVLLIISLAAGAEEQAGDELKSQPLFEEHAPLTIRLEAPYKKLLRGRGTKRPYFPAALVYTDAAGEEHRLELKVRVRGNYRAKRDTCRFPPLKLNFKKESTKGTVFEGQDKLKLVTHCQSGSRYEQFVRLEYMAYRMQNHLTPYSLRPRMANIEYFESDKKKVEATKVGFFIEDKGLMARRAQAELVEQPRIDKTLYRQDQLHLATVFEYMIGNTDYSVILGPKGENCCHNIIPVKLADGTMVPVPYDFDVTGFVNPPYASPPEHLGIRSLRQRLYRGYCQNTAGFKESFAVFNEQKDAIYGLFGNIEGMQTKTVNSATRYLDDFYEYIGDDDKIVSQFIEKCRKK